MRRRTRSRGTTDLLSGSGFTPRQVTALVLAVLLAVVLVPVGAQAAQVVSAIITDPAGTNKAHVDASGSLQVGDGSGALTIDGDVSVDGAVSSQPTAPAEPFEDFSRLLPNGQTGEFIFGPVEADTKLAITSITVANHGPNDEEALVSSYAVHALDCESPGAGVDFHADVVVPAGETIHLAYPQPLVVSVQPVLYAGWCLRVDELSVPYSWVDISVVGFVI
jgi:hypothetical protein